jgi:hypothetical protein
VKKALLPVLLSVFLIGLGPARLAHAQAATTKPVLTVSFAGYDPLVRDAGLIAQMVGQPDAIKGLEAMLNMMTQGKVLPNLDKTRPWGLIVELTGMPPSVCAFVPATDLSQLVGALAALQGGAPPEAVDGVYEIDAQGQKVYATQKGEWAFVTNQRTVIDNPPADPLGLLGGLEKKYVIAAEINVKNIPPDMRQMFIGLIRQGAEMGAMRQPGESDEQYALRQRMSRQAMEEFEKAVNEMDRIVLGLEVDHEAKTIAYDINVTAIEGTDTAQEYAALADTTSDFGAFYDESAALTFHVASKLTAANISQMKQLIATFRADALEDIENQQLSEQERALAGKMIGDLMDVADATAESGRIDAGLSVLFQSNALTVIAGGHIADGAKLDEVFKRLLNLLMQEQPEAAQLIKLNADEHAGAKFHTLTLPPEAMGPDGPPPELFGGTLTVALGIAEEGVYFGLGARALDALKQTIDASKAAAGQSVSPFRMSLSASSIADVAQAAAPEEAGAGPAAAVIGALKQAGANDHIKLTTKPIPNGVNARLEIEEGILQSIGKVVAGLRDSMGGGAPPDAAAGPDDPF